MERERAQRGGALSITLITVLAFYEFCHERQGFVAQTLRKISHQIKKEERALFFLPNEISIFLASGEHKDLQ